MESKLNMLIAYINVSEYKDYYYWEISRFYGKKLNSRNIRKGIEQILEKYFEGCDKICVVEKEIARVMFQKKFHFLRVDKINERAWEVYVL